MNTIFLSDLDGTLLDDGACLPVSVRQELAGLLERGLPFTVATGRTHLSVGPIFQGLPMAVPWVLMNGALILAPSDGAVLDRVPLGKTAWRELVRAEEELGLSGLLLGTEGDRLHATLGGACTPVWEAFFRRNHVTGPPPVSAGRAEDWDGEDLLYGIYIHPQMALLTELARRLTAHGGFRVDLYRDRYDRDTCCLELYSADASKGRAAETLRRLTGARRLVAFGDGENDLPLFQVCDECYAVKNAAPEVKAAAHGVIGSCEEGGVVQYLERRWRDEGVV